MTASLDSYSARMVIGDLIEVSYADRDGSNITRFNGMVKSRQELFPTEPMFFNEKISCIKYSHFNGTTGYDFYPNEGHTVVRRLSDEEATGYILKNG